MNLAHLIDDHPADRVALISRGLPTTYGELRAQVAAMRRALGALGIVRGDRVAVACGNGVHFVVSYLAALGVGAVVVPLNPTSPAPELERELAVVTPKVIVLEPVAAATWQGIDAAIAATIPHVIVTEGQAIEGAVAFDTLLEGGGDALAIADVRVDDLAVLIFTSGTAGAPRAAMLSHGNLLANLAQAQTAREKILPTDVIYCVLPLHHIFGLNVVLGLSLQLGATVVLAQRFDPATALDTIAERGVTIVPGAPPMWVSWSMFADAPADSLSTVRLAFSGAAKLPELAASRVREHFGLTVSEGYGLTEAAPSVTSASGMPARPGSIGKVLDGIEIRLVDEQGDDVLRGDSGEIWLRGPNIFQGYLGDAEATARALTVDGWLRTGDIAVSDDDGYLYLVDRAKDLIIVSGFNVYPAEVEEVLAEHPGVAEVAVVGVPHPHSGEAVKAYVVAEAGVHLDEEQLIAHCADNLARYKCPNKILFVDELPRGLSGKLLRRELT